MHRRSLILALVALASHPAAAGIVAISNALARPTVRGGSTSVADRTVTFGHLSLTFEEGTFSPVIVDDTPVGAFFTGRARFTYTQTDPVMDAAYRSNVKRSTRYTVANDGSVSDSVEQALILMSSGAPELFELRAPVDGEGPRPRGSEVSSALEAYRKGLANVEMAGCEQIVGQALVDQPGEPLVWVQLITEKERLVYVYDTLRDLQESLTALVEPKTHDPRYEDRLFPQLLSTQPIGRAWTEPRERRFVLVDVDVDLVNPEGTRAQVTVTERFHALQPIRTLGLDLWSRRWVGVGLTGAIAEAEYRLVSVQTDKGGELQFSHRDGDLVVELETPLAAGEEVTLRFRLVGDLLDRPSNLSYWLLPTDAWLPLPHRLEEQFFTYHAVVRVPKPFTPFSSGRTLRRWEEGDLACAEFKEAKPIQVPVILAGKYVTREETRDGFTIRVSRYVMTDERSMRQITDLAFGLKAFFEQYFGPYPFDELNIIEINSYGYGQAPADIVFITKEAFSPLEDLASRFFSEGINARLAHELAHGWWGHMAKLGEPEDRWLSESVAEYVSAYAIGELWRESEFKQAMGRWKGMTRIAKDTATVYTASYVSGIDGYREEFALLYGKGPMMLHALRGELGDKVFFTILKSFVSNFQFKYAQTRHFIGMSSFVAKRDLKPFFDRYLMGTEKP